MDLNRNEINFFSPKYKYYLKELIYLISTQNIRNNLNDISPT